MGNDQSSNKDEMNMIDNGGEELNLIESNQESNKKLSFWQKLVTAGLVLFGILVVVMWYLDFKQGIKAPFENKYSNQAQNQDELSEDDQLKSKDTDNDGLSDFDEINTHQTSPYLEDSDSDGVFDKKEIDSGENPNCPTGKDCSVLSEDIIEEKEEGVNVPVLDMGIKSGSSTSLNINNSSQDYEKLLQGELDASAIREMLASSGLDTKVLDSISDEDLIQLYKEAVTGN